MGSGRLRLFVAVEVPANVREAVAAAAGALRALAPDARWVDPSRWHLTLAFLGGVEAERVPDVTAALAAATAGARPPTLALDGTAGTFRREVLWAGLTTDDDLVALAGRVRSALVEAEVAFDDKPFRAHLTLARAGRGRRLPAALAAAYDGPTTSWRVGDVRLVRSHLAGRGSRYTVEARFTLAEGP